MKVKIKAFGRLAEIVHAGFELDGVQNTGELRYKLELQFPSLKGSVYALAVDHQIISVDVPLGEGSEVALLPPYSGG